MESYVLTTDSFNKYILRAHYVTGKTFAPESKAVTKKIAFVSQSLLELKREMVSLDDNILSVAVMHLVFLLR